jgi:hypothetical protein
MHAPAPRKKRHDLKETFFNSATALAPPRACALAEPAARD